MFALLLALQTVPSLPPEKIPPELVCVVRGATAIGQDKDSVNHPLGELADTVAEYCGETIAMDCSGLPPTMQDQCTAGRDRLTSYLSEAARSIIVKEWAKRGR